MLNCIGKMLCFYDSLIHGTLFTLCILALILIVDACQYVPHDKKPKYACQQAF